MRPRLDVLNVGLGVGLFCAAALYDAIWAWYLIAVSKRRPVLGASLSASIYLLSAIGVLAYTRHRWMVLPLAGGMWVGTFFVVKFSREP